MGYVGNEPDANYTSFAQQTITGNGGTSYTLSHAVASGKEILLYINNVKQEEGSGKAYEATGTTLTLSEAITSSDSCYCVFLGKALQTTVPPDGSVTSAKLDTNIAVSGNLDVGTIRATNGTTAQTIDSTGRVLTPARPCFSAYRNTTSGTYYDSGDLVFDATTVNVGSCYDTSNGRFTAPITGAYHLSCSIGSIYDDNSGSQFGSNDWVQLQLKINGSSGSLNPKQYLRVNATFETGFSISHVFQLTAGDYVIAHIRANDTDSGDGGFAYNSSTGFMHYSGFLIG